MSRQEQSMDNRESVLEQCFQTIDSESTDQPECGTDRSVDRSVQFNLENSRYKTLTFIRSWSPTINNEQLWLKKF